MTSGASRVDVLARLQRIARALRWIRFPALALAFACAALFLAIVLELLDAPDSALLPAVVGVMWGASLYAFVGGFQHVPARAQDDANAIRRLGHTIVRAWYWSLAMAMAVATAAIAILTVRFLTIWLG